MSIGSTARRPDSGEACAGPVSAAVGSPLVPASRRLLIELLGIVSEVRVGVAAGVASAVVRLRRAGPGRLAAAASEEADLTGSFLPRLWTRARPTAKMLCDDMPLLSAQSNRPPRLRDWCNQASTTWETSRMGSSIAWRICLKVTDRAIHSALSPN